MVQNIEDPVDLGAHFSDAKANGQNISKLFTPPNFANFVLTGTYKRFLANDTIQSCDDQLLFIIGCGRSGTTLLFELLES